MSHYTEITHFEESFSSSKNQNCLLECAQEKNIPQNDISNKMDSTEKNSRIDSAIVVAKKLINDLCKINTRTISKDQYDKLQRKYIRLEIQAKGFKHQIVLSRVCKS